MFLFVLNEFINKEAPFGVIPQCAKFIASKPQDNVLKAPANPETPGYKNRKFKSID